MTRFSRHSLVIVFLSLALVIGVSAGAGAASIPITNNSFELPPTSTWTNGVITGWDTPLLSIYDGVQNNIGVYWAISGGDLKQEAYIQNDSSNPGRISQILKGYTIQAGDTYTLSALVGSYYANNLATYHVQLFDADLGVLLKEAYGTPNTGSFVPVSIQYVANDPSHYTHTLEIVLANTGPSTEIEYDKVTLNYVPLPPTALLLGSGLLGLGLLRRKWSLKK